MEFVLVTAEFIKEQQRQGTIRSVIAKYLSALLEQCNDLGIPLYCNTKHDLVYLLYGGMKSMPFSMNSMVLPTMSEMLDYFCQLRDAGMVLFGVGETAPTSGRPKPQPKLTPEEIAGEEWVDPALQQFVREEATEKPVVPAAEGVTIEAADEAAKEVEEAAPEPVDPEKELKELSRLADDVNGYLERHGELVYYYRNSQWERESAYKPKHEYTGTAFVFRIPEELELLRKFIEYDRKELWNAY